MDVEKSVSMTGLVANVATAIRSAAGLAATNARAAATAFVSGSPFIETDRSTARTKLRARPMFSASSPATARPFSVTVGAVVPGSAVSTVNRTSG